jgi:hypothetical protein
MQHWWCYIGYKELFKEVYKRLPTPEENAHYKSMNRETINLWVLQHVGQTNGLYIAIDQRQQNGYIAFTMLPYFMIGIFNKEIPVPVNGMEASNDAGNGSYNGVRIAHEHIDYRVTSWWRNSTVDQGETTIKMDVSGYLSDFRIKSPKFPQELIYNWDSRQWEQITPQSLTSNAHISKIG